jgi:DeoR/GlpR family transcriptional regulator of sugar metabolism
MIPAERRNKIVDFIRKNKTASIQQLCDEFEISEITMRRDFDILSKKDLIRKVYGGAVIVDEVPIEASLLKRMNENIDEKRRIAGEAVKRISNGDTILLESGTTCQEVAKLLYKKQNINVVTAAPHIINLICSMSRDRRFNGELICPGGIWRGEPDDLFVGPQALNFFNNVKINIAFFGIFAINLYSGWMAPSIFEAELTKKIISCSEKVIGIAHHSKFNNVSFNSIGPISLFNEIITDKGLSEKDYEKYSIATKVTLV